MSKPIIKYRAGYEYQLAETYQVLVAVRPAVAIRTPYVDLDQYGTLTIREGYAWDGPSGPAIDTKNFMRGSLIHDALYQPMRAWLLNADQWREVADQELRRICREDGMSALRAWWVYHGVRLGGGPAASRAGERPLLTAP